MKLSNNPDIAVGQEWMLQLDAWLDQNPLRGFDPFDVKAHPKIAALQERPLLRKSATALTDAFPHLSRKMLRVAPTENPKAFALVAAGSVRMQQISDEAHYHERAKDCLAWLEAHSLDAGGALCWGYPFSVRGQGVAIEADTPITVVTAIVGNAFLDAYRASGEERWLDAARRAADAFLDVLAARKLQEGAHYFPYAAGDARPVHNANLLAVELLTRVWGVTEEQQYFDAAASPLAFTLARQQEDGSWPYGELLPGAGHEPALMRLVDHHHSGFVLRSLHQINKARPQQEVREALDRGYRFYRGLVLPNGMPVSRDSRYPVDIHACAEAILCPSVLAESMFMARNKGIPPLRWAFYYMRDPRTGLPYYRKYRGFTVKMPYPRWGTAWIYRALAEFLLRQLSESKRESSAVEE